MGSLVCARIVLRDALVVTFGSLFSGIGGMDLGLERAGMQCRWQVENDPYCNRVLEKHWPNVKRYGDIRQIDGRELEAVDLLCGGFPCQPVSLAGKRKRQLDERWLWPEFARILRLLRPRWVLIENVPGLLVGDWDELADPADDPLWKSGMSDVLGELAGSGYDAEWDCIPAAALGSPHLRYRTFIVAYPQGGREVLCAAGSRGEGQRKANANGSRQEHANDATICGNGSHVAEQLRWEGRAATAAEARKQGQSSRRKSGGIPANAVGVDAHNGGHGASEVCGERSRAAEVPRCRIFADPPGARLQERQNQDLIRELAALERDVADLNRRRGNKRNVALKTRNRSAREACEEITGTGWWAAEPGLVRMVHGIPHRVDRIRGLGNAVVPQVAQFIGERIEAENQKPQREQ